MNKNAIVVMFDSLQYNYVGCYGNDWIKTPNMDRFAREGVLFENAYTEGLPTVPCRRAMHTGRFSLPVRGWSALTLEETTIADLCWGQGIETAIIFDSGPYRLPKFGYNRGFDTSIFLHGHENDANFYNRYPDPVEKPEDYIEDHIMRDADAIAGCRLIDPIKQEISDYLRQRQFWKSPEDRYCAKTFKKAIEWLRTVDRTQPFFLWIDSFDPHEPWDPPSVYLKQPCPYDPDYKGKDMFLPMLVEVEGIYTEEELHHVRMLYAELVTLCDVQFGRLLDAVRELGLEDNTMILMVSDHGEPMGTGEHGHGIMRKIRPWPYEELAHVPMLLRAPGLPKGKRVKAFVQSCDVAPTVCEWLGLGVQSFHQGKSLLPLARGEAEKTHEFAIAGYHKYSWSIITEEWSYIHWLKNDAELNAADMFMDFYGKGVAETSEHIPAMENAPTWQNVTKLHKNFVNEEQRKYLEAASLDGEEQWTCTPGSEAKVPDQDELYCRKTDPKQLHNVIAEHPDVARTMLQKLRNYMEELRAS
ncbi:MAG TPA: sulfatase [Candidatus Mailhella merdavium]|nr:sulfatase [Candidatus Mailhella merdavium]